MKNEISLPVVKNKNRKFVHIKNINNDNRNLKYFCPCCNSIVKPRSINEDNKTQPHFYHLDTTKCKQETVYHFVYKHWMFVKGKIISALLDDKEVEYVCDKVEIEQTHETINGLYTPDLTLYTECGKTIYIEINYSNKKKVDGYFVKWKELGNIVSEINIRQLFNNDYSETNLKIPVIFDGNECLEHYKVSLSKDSYYNNIYKHKLSQEYSEERMQQLEKLDWFYRDICKYIHNSISKEELLETFSYVEYQDMEVCYEMIKKKTCCKPLKNDFKEIINKSFEDYMNNLQISISDNFVYLFSFEKGESYIVINCNLKYVGNYDLIINKNNNSTSSVRYYNLLPYSLFEDTVNKMVAENEKKLTNVLLVVEKYKDLKSKNIDNNTLLSNFKFSDIEMLREFDIEYNKKHIFRSINCIRINAFKNKLEEIKVKIINFISNTYSEDIFENIEFDFVHNRSYCNNMRYAEIKLQYINSGNNFFSWETYTLKDLVEDNVFVDICEKIKNFIDIELERCKEIIVEYDRYKEKIKNIFDNNKELIVDYEVNKFINDTSIPVIWFKTIDSIEYVYIVKDLKTTFEHITSHFNTIDISNILNYRPNEIYIRKDYHLTPNQQKDVVVYDFPNLFLDKEINVSFNSKSIGSNNIYVKDFNIVNATKEISHVLNEINAILAIEIKNINDSKKIFLSPKRISYLEINNKITDILSPILRVVNESLEDIINISFNIKDTIINNSGYQPWLIKDFIEKLQLIDIFNFENVRR